MATSYADSAQAREWDRRHDEWGHPRRAKESDFHDYEAAALVRTQALAEREVRLLAERKASAKRINAAVDQLAEFWGLKEKPNEPQSWAID